MWSIIALVIAALSIGYCFSHIIDLVSEWCRTIESSHCVSYKTNERECMKVKKNKRIQYLVWSSLVVLVFNGIAILFPEMETTDIVGKSYVESDDFQMGNG